MILVLAKLTPKEGKDDEIINAALTLVGETRIILKHLVKLLNL